MSVALAPIALRLGQLVRLLASNHDGEALAAARALSRALQKAGADFNDLADRIERAPEPAAAPGRAKSRRSPRQTSADGPGQRGASQPKQGPRPGRRGRRAPTWDELAIGYRLRWLDAALRAGATTAWEHQFIADIRRLIAADSRRSPSPRQRRILDAVIAKAWRAGAQP